VGLANLRIAFPHWTEAQRERVLEASFANVARGVAELAFLQRLTPENLGEVVRFEGLEHFESARRDSGGAAIGLSAHFGNFELLAVAMALRGAPLAIVHRERSPRLDALIQGWRGSQGARLLARGSAARASLRALHEGRVLAMLVDQDTPKEEGVFVPFFGRLACTRDAPARIAMKTGAPVVPFFIFREGTSGRHVIRCSPRLALVPEGQDREAAIFENVRRMTRVVEDAIREAPDQWTWSHRRWHNQPPGEPRPYSSRRHARRTTLEPGPGPRVAR
jgi:KDO2-lipid IV(A) lauroyltransferase